jgi:hypothetical protein
MVAPASGFGMGVARLSRPLRGVRVIAIVNAGLDTTRRIEVSPGLWCTMTAGTWHGGWSMN